MSGILLAIYSGNPIKLNFPEPTAELIFSDEQLDKDPKLAYLVNKL